MDPYQETFNTWDKIAKLYHEQFMDLEYYNESYDLFCNLIKNKQQQILELACGPGNISKHILKQLPNAELTAVDVSENMISLAKINNPGATFLKLDIRNINGIKQKFDGIIGGFCIPYISTTEVEQLIQNCNNLLKKNGILYLSFVEGDPSKSGFQKGTSGDRSYFYYHELNHLLNQFEKNKIRTIKIMHVAFPRKNGTTEIHTITIAEKE